MQKTDSFKDPANAGRSSTSRNIILLVLNLIGIAVIFILPKNTSFIKFKVQGFYATKAAIGYNTDSTARYHLIYNKEAAMVHLLDSVLTDDDVFLLPPQYYLVENVYKTSPATDPYTWTYPSKFKNLVMNKFNFVEITAPDSLLTKATHTFLADKKRGLRLVNLNDYSATQKEAIINHLKIYKPFGFFIPQTAIDYLKHKTHKQWKR